MAQIGSLRTGQGYALITLLGAGTGRTGTILTTRQVYFLLHVLNQARILIESRILCLSEVLSTLEHRQTWTTTSKAWSFPANLNSSQKATLQMQQHLLVWKTHGVERLLAKPWTRRSPDHWKYSGNGSEIKGLGRFRSAMGMLVCFYLKRTAPSTFRVFWQQVVNKKFSRNIVELSSISWQPRLGSISMVNEMQCNTPRNVEMGNTFTRIGTSGILESSIFSYSSPQSPLARSWFEQLY